MSADEVLHVRAGDSSFSLVSEDPELLAGFGEYSVASDGDRSDLLGFKVSKSGRGIPLWTLVGIDGSVLARSRNRLDVVEVLRRHLDSLTMAVPARGVLRLALRVVVGSGGDAVLVDPRLLRSQPVIERAFVKAGLVVVDAPFVDLDPQNLTLAYRSGDAQELSQVAGHIAPGSAASATVRSIAWPAYSGAPEATYGQTAHALASVLRSGDRSERLEAAARMAAPLEVLLVEQHKKGTLLNALTPGSA